MTPAQARLLAIVREQTQPHPEDPNPLPGVPIVRVARAANQGVHAVVEALKRLEARKKVRIIPASFPHAARVVLA